VAYTALQALPAAPWRPLVRGTETARLMTVVHAVADALRDPDRLPPARESAGQRAFKAAVGGDASLASGHAGLALLFVQLLRRTRRPEDLDAAVAHLNRAIELAAGLPYLGLASGLAGVAFAATQVRRVLPAGTPDPVAEVDDVILDAVRDEAWHDEYDLIGGLVGLGAVCLERWPAPGAVQGLAHIVRQLERLAEHRGDGVAWLTPVVRVPVHQRSLAPAGYFNTGAAHGVPAVVALLAAAQARGVGTPATGGLTAAAVRWLLAQRLPAAETSVFPSWVPVGEHPPPPARVAWCYGDAGVAAMLLSAARSADRADWRQAALATARRAAALPEAACGVQDAGLCHGAAGLAHLFQIMHRDTGDPVLARGARTWLRRTLAFRRPGTGVAGFSSWAPDDDGNLHWATDRSLLSGAAGVALALLAAVSRAEPHWNRMLVVAPPPLGPEDVP
jgi:hypothetical protein